MSDRFEIRPARPEDASALVEMIQTMARETEGRTLATETLQAGVKAVFDNPLLGTYWVIAEGERALGCTLITIEWSDWNNAPYWWIQSLYFQPELRGQGMFHRLLSHLEAEGKRAGACEIRLYVERNNERAIRAYEKSGFESDYYLCMTKSLNKAAERAAPEPASPA